jgi:2-methylcitrate dehydratase PrpD
MIIVPVWLHKLPPIESILPNNAMIHCLDHNDSHSTSESYNHRFNEYSKSTA